MEGGRTIIIDSSGHYLFKSDQSNIGLYSILLYYFSAKALVKTHRISTYNVNNMIVLAVSQSKAMDLATWHHRLGHIG